MTVMAEKKLVKIYMEDWEILNRYLSIRQVQEGKRLTFADIIAEVIEENVKPIVDEVKALLKR